MLGWAEDAIVVYLFLAFERMSYHENKTPFVSIWEPWMLFLVFLPYLLLGIVAIAGGIAALKRKAWGLALAGSICGTLNGIFYLGIPAIVLLAIARKEKLFS